MAPGKSPMAFFPLSPLVRPLVGPYSLVHAPVATQHGRQATRAAVKRWIARSLAPFLPRVASRDRSVGGLPAPHLPNQEP